MGHNIKATFQSAGPQTVVVSVLNDLVSEGATGYDGAGKLRTCKVHACNKTVIVIRAAQVIAQSKQLQMMPVRQFSLIVATD